MREHVEGPARGLSADSMRLPLGGQTAGSGRVGRGGSLFL